VPATRRSLETPEREAQVEATARLIGSDLTTAGAAFMSSHMELVGFIGFVGELANRIDGVLDVIDQADGEQGATRPKRRVSKELDPHRKVMQEVLLSRGVDSYLTYVSELLALIFKTRPETLRSKEQVRIDFVLGFDTMEELQDAIAERRVERLAYRGMKELSEWVEATLGFTLVPDERRLRVIERMVEQRNLITHHRGVIDYRYVRRLGNADGGIGDVLDLGESPADAILTTAQAVADADSRAAAKWGIERKPYRMPRD
jgi:hypothetical protein